jgi:hypothetical protein
MRYCFALPTPRTGITAESLAEHLRMEIDRSAARYLVIHTGLAYMRYPDEFVGAIRQVAKTFPEVQIIIEKIDDTSADLARHGLLSRSGEANAIRQIVFRS